MDPGTQQRLFDPATMNFKIDIDEAKIDGEYLNVKFKAVNVLEDQNLRQGIKDFSDWPTIPQLYVKKEFIGGCDIVKEMFEKGELQKKLTENKNIEIDYWEDSGHNMHSTFPKKFSLKYSTFLNNYVNNI